MRWVGLDVVRLSLVSGKTYVCLWRDDDYGHSVEDAMYSDSQIYSNGRLFWVSSEVENPTHVLCGDDSTPFVLDGIELE